MERRSFLRTATGSALSMPFLLNGTSLQAMGRSALFSGLNPDNDRVLVLIQLTGGNDGLNMLVPMDQYDNLAQVRSNILIPENHLLPLNDTLHVHGSFTSLRELYDNGQAGIVQSVGYPNQNRSHFRSTDIWTTASPANEIWTDGWLGRYMDTLYDNYPEGYPNDEHPHPFAISMSNSVSETCQGAVANYSMALKDPFSLAPLAQGEETELPDTPYGWELSFLRNAIVQSNAYGEVITAAAENGNSLAEYTTGNKLAEQLRNVALLISGGLSTSVYVVSLGGFDTHANQVVEGTSTEGEHAVLLQTVSEAIASFQEDLNMLGLQERVLSMTFSEFGRRIRSNDSLGTDHGTAAPLMLFGECVNPQILGTNPVIDTEVDNKEGIPMQYDFRDIYGSVLTDWFEVEEDIVRNLLYSDFTHLPVIQTCEIVDTDEAALEDVSTLNAFPNPCRNNLKLQFSIAKGQVRLGLFDAIGSEVKTISNRSLAAGQHTVHIDMSGLPAGVYFARLQMGEVVRTERIVKMQ